MRRPNVYENNPLLHVGKRSLESSLIESEAIAYGLSTLRVNNYLFYAEDAQGAKLGFRRAASSLSSVVADEFCADKAAAKALMKLHGVPTALGQKMPPQGVKSAIRFAERNGWPVVVKPLRGSGGRGVTADIRTEESLRAAIKHADSRAGFLMEQHVSGEDYRFLVVGDRVAGVWVREAANVVGDGELSIDELIDQKNEIRSTNPHLFIRPIAKDSLVKEHLARKGKDLAAVPRMEETVYLRSAANLSSGGDNIDVTDEVHESLNEIAVRAKTLIPGTELVGVDMLLEDHRLPANGQSVNVCEVNGRPGISAHNYPMYGPPRNAARGYVERLSERGGVTLCRYADNGVFKGSVYGRFLTDQYEEFVKRWAIELDVGINITVSSPGYFEFFLTSRAIDAAVLDCLLVSPPSSRIGVVEGCRMERVS